MKSYDVEIKRIFVETEELNGKGNPKLRPIVQRKMFVRDPDSFTDSGFYRIVLKGGKYTISVLPRIPQNIYKNPTGKLERWYTVSEDYKRTDDPSMTYEEIRNWLLPRIGEKDTKEALDTLTA